MNILDPRVWLAFVLAIALTSGVSYHKGGIDERTDTIAKQAAAAAQAREAEGELRRMDGKATDAYIKRITTHQEKFRALPTIALPINCVVPSAASRVLNDAQRVPGDAGTGPGSRAAGAEVDSTCAAELDIAKRNYADVCTINEAQLKEIQERWERTRLIVNQGRN